MKKRIKMLMAAALLCGCSADDELYLQESVIFVNVGKTAYIEVLPSSKGCRFTSDDKSIAEVTREGGIVTGKSVGVTSVRVVNNRQGFSESCIINVTPADLVFREPYLGGEGVAADVKVYEERVLQYESETLLVYKGENSNVSQVLYSLEGGVLVSSVIMVKDTEDNFEMIKKILGRTYIVTEKSGKLAFHNEGMTIAVEVGRYDSGEIAISYRAYAEDME